MLIDVAMCAADMRQNPLIACPAPMRMTVGNVTARIIKGLAS
jgi:hypothetical protein